MRVVFVIDSLVHGGTERSVVELVLGLSAEGLDPTVVMLEERGGLSEVLRARGIEVGALEGGSRRARIEALRHRLVLLRPDLVHTQLFEADLVGRVAGRLARVPTVSSLVNLSYGAEHRAAPGIRRHRLALAQLADASSARVVRRFHAVSEVVADVMSRRLLVPRRKIEVVPRGRDAGVLGRRTPDRSSAVRRALGLGPEVPIVLAVGRHEWQKGFDVLLDALHRVQPRQPTSLLIAGREGNVTSDLHRRASTIDRGAWDVRFLGSRDDVADLMAAADVLVCSSRWEGLPGALIEALALEVPMVVTDIGPNREVVSGLAGVRFVAPASALDLGDALMESLVTPPPTDGHRARFDERYELSAVARQMEAFYERALG